MTRANPRDMLGGDLGYMLTRALIEVPHGSRRGAGSGVDVQGTALTIVRVRRGEPRPDEATLRAALRSSLGRNDRTGEPITELVTAGPYAVAVDGQELDEYVVWER